MSKTHLAAALSIPVLLLSIGMILGSLPTNYFGEAGLLLSLLSAVITILVASRNAYKARRAAIAGIEPYEPISAKRMKLFSGITMTTDRLDNIEKQLVKLRQDHENLAGYVDMRIESVYNYAQMAHERMTLHEEVELPQILGAQSGVIITGAVLSLVGAIVVFAPEQVYAAFSGINSAAGSLAGIWRLHF